MSNELQDARLMAGSAREDANAATSAAEKTRREQKVLVERLRRLETEAFGQPQQEQPVREQRRLGLSDYEPASAAGRPESPRGGIS